MNKVFSGGRSHWVILLTISLLCAMAFLFVMVQERTKRIVTEQKLSEVEKAKRAIEIKFDHAQLELIQLKNQARILSDDLEKEKKDYQAALAELEKKEASLKDLEGDLTNEKQQRTDLANTLAQLKESYNRLEEQLQEAKLNLEQEQTVKKDAEKQGVELKKIVVKPKKSLSGKVLVVNREFKFVVIDLGKKDGVNVGDEFSILQGSEEIGKVKVERVYDTMSTAAILAGSREPEIVEDTIVKSF